MYDFTSYPFHAHTSIEQYITQVNISPILVRYVPDTIKQTLCTPKQAGKRI
jgi:hypothetical protein